MSTPSGNPHPSDHNPQPPVSGPAGQQGPSPYGYQAAQPSGYAYPSAANLPQAERPPLPKEVNIAFWLIIAAGVVSLISAFMPVDTSAIPPEMRDMMVGFAVGGGVVGLAIYVLLAIFIRKGHNWARITATVLAGLSVFGLFTGNILGILSILLGLVAVGLLYMKPSNNYFKPQQPTY